MVHAAIELWGPYIVYKLLKAVGRACNVPGHIVSVQTGQALCQEGRSLCCSCCIVQGPVSAVTVEPGGNQMVTAGVDGQVCLMTPPPDRALPSLTITFMPILQWLSSVQSPKSGLRTR